MSQVNHVEHELTFSEAIGLFEIECTIEHLDRDNFKFPLPHQDGEVPAVTL